MKPARRRRPWRWWVGLVLAGLAAACGTPSEPAFRAPVLAERDWEALVPVLGDFGPRGGAFEGRFELAQFQGYRYAAPPQVSVRLRLVRLDGDARPVLIFYGPQQPTGVFGPPQRVAETQNGAVTLTREGLAGGTFLIVVTTGSRPASGTYRLVLECLSGCDESPTCPLRDACPVDTVCSSGYVLDAAGCPTCECRDECRVDGDCGPEESCLGGACVEYCTCRDPFEPVCGSDGVTYLNACEAGCQGARVLAEGACREDCPIIDCDIECPNGFQRDDRGCQTCACLDRCDACHRRVEPICTRRGETALNYCLAACRGQEAAYPGVCEPACEPLECSLTCAQGLVRDADGCPRCECAESDCPLELALVCGSDGLTYLNACEAERAGATILFESACPTWCDGAGDCPERFECRSGVLGLPECPLNSSDCLAVCIRNRIPCGSAMLCPNGDTCSADGVCASPCDCKPIWMPICGEDGATYENACRARCRGVTPASFGPCPSATDGG